MQAVGNQKWGCFKSDKVAEISYASKLLISIPSLCPWMLNYNLAIQGKDCLVQKFRNSSVMLEAPHYRPKVSLSKENVFRRQLTLVILKLFFTDNGPCPHLAGQEEPFPEPDNQSKMKRSCENAEHVGKW